MPIFKTQISSINYHTLSRPCMYRSRLYGLFFIFSDYGRKLSMNPRRASSNRRDHPPRITDNSRSPLHTAAETPSSSPDYGRVTKVIDCSETTAGSGPNS